jgi:FG-GAP-like repeat/Abnormal spindle-like microcephaly-assoc'd, ASPM-SPD-2-Hydin
MPGGATSLLAEAIQRSREISLTSALIPARSSLRVRFYWIRGGTLFAIICGMFSAPAAAQFETRGSFQVLQSPVSIAVGDFNCDGKPDIAVAVFLTSQVAVLLGNGNGTFRPATYYNINTEMESVDSVAVADFNHDGKLDIVVTNRLANSVGLMMGNGDGTFQPVTNIPINASPFFVAVGDFNGDGNPDVVTLDEGGLCPCITVMLGNGDGTFQTPINTIAPYPDSAAGLGDFNRDGKLDLATVGQFGSISELGILLGNGDGTFQAGPSYPIGDFPDSIAVADFDKDHRLDLVVSAGFGVTVFLGNGDGTFREGETYLVSFPGIIQVSDFNGDGSLDLVVANGGLFGKQVSVLFGNGDGTFQPPVNFPAGAEVAFVAVGDFNGDHQPDLVTADFLRNCVTVLLNTGVVSFSPTTPLDFPTQLVGTISTPQDVILTNTGETMLSIPSMQVRGQFQLGSGTTCGTSLPPGANCTISVMFQPTAIGFKDGLVSISDSASTKPQVIKLGGTGTVISVSPTQIAFPPQKVGTKSAAQNVTVTNTGSTVVSVTGVTIIGNNPEDYIQRNTCGSQIGGGASCTIAITFAPTETGVRSAAVSIADDGGSSPQTVALTGTGVER